MVDVKRLMSEILRQRPDLNEQRLEQLIADKKARVGAGYLSDTGAAYLIASDLNVSLEHIYSHEAAIKDLYVGATDVSITARVFAIYPLKKYEMRNGGHGELRRIIVFQGDQMCKAVFWDDQARLVESLGLRPDVIVRIEGASVKAGLDGKPTLHLGERSRVTLLEVSEETPPNLNSITRDVSLVNAPASHMSLLGVLRSPFRTSSFKRRDGSTGTMTQLRLGSLQDNRELRVVLWDIDDSLLRDTPTGSVVKLVNVRARPSPRGEIEVHGDALTQIEFVSQMPVKKVQQAAQKRFRMISYGPPQREKDGSTYGSALLLDENSVLHTLIVRGDAFTKLSSTKLDQVISCSPKEAMGTTLVCESAESISETSDENDFPTIDKLLKKIKDIAPSNTPILLNAVALSRTVIQEVSLREGKVVRRGELMVGDETGEVKIVAWRDLTSILEGIAPGERLCVRGVLPSSGRNGPLTLQVRPFTFIQRVTSSTG